MLPRSRRWSLLWRLRGSQNQILWVRRWLSWLRCRCRSVWSSARRRSARCPVTYSWIRRALRRSRRWLRWPHWCSCCRHGRRRLLCNVRRAIEGLGLRRYSPRVWSLLHRLFSLFLLRHRRSDGLVRKWTWSADGRWSWCWCNLGRSRAALQERCGSPVRPIPRHLTGWSAPGLGYR